MWFVGLTNSKKSALLNSEGVKNKAINLFHATNYGLVNYYWRIMYGFQPTFNPRRPQRSDTFN